MDLICKKQKKINHLSNEDILNLLKGSGTNNFLYKTFEYLIFFNNIFDDIDVKVEKQYFDFEINILDNLIQYLTENKNYICNMNLVNNNKKYTTYFIDVILKKLKTINNRTTFKISLNEKKFIVRHIEFLCSKIDFILYLKNKYEFKEEFNLLFTKYSSILHLILISKNIIYKYNLNFNYTSSISKSFRIKQLINIKNNGTISLYLTNKTKSIIQDLNFNKSLWIKQLIMRYCFFNFILKTENTPKYTTLFLIDFEKEFLNNDRFLPSEINTGITNGINIIITRKEEALKTLLHELIHFHNMDFRSLPNKVNQTLQYIFKNVENEGDYMKLNLFEAHTEAIASIYNICLFFDYNNKLFRFYNLYKNNKYKTKYFKNYLTFIRDQLNNQINYTYSKCYEILLKKCSDNSSNFKIKNLLSCNIKQKTNLFSYFFIKSLIYKNLVNYIKKCTYNTSLKFIDRYESFNYILEIIQNELEQNKSNFKIEKIYKKSYTFANNKIKFTCILETI